MGKKLFEELELFLFDMDGLLFDTETVYIEYGRRIAEDMGFYFDDSFIEKSTGATNEAFKEMCLSKFGEKFDFDSYCERVESYLKNQADRGEVPLLTGALEILQYLRENNKKIVLATSAGLEMAERLLKSKNIENYFDYMITAELVSKGKPDPEVFLTGAYKAGAEPSRTMVFEDSYNGIRAAHAAGMYPVMIPDKLKPNDEIRKLYFKEFSSLLDVIKYFENELQ